MTTKLIESLYKDPILNPHKEKIAQEQKKKIRDLINKTTKKVNKLSEVSISNLGGCSTVTGSSTLIEVKRKGKGKSNPHSVLIDLGMFQGTGNDIEHNRILPFDRSKLEAIILTHAHLDHIGRVPMLEKDEILIKKPSGEIVKSSKSFNGFIYTSHAGKGLTEVMLVDSARVMAKEQVAKMKMIEGKKANLTDMIKQLENLKKCQNISFGRKGRTNTSIQELNFQEHINEQILKIEEERAKYRGINIGNIDKVFKTFSKDIEDKILYTTKEVDAVKSKIKGTGFYKEKSISSLKGQKTNPGISFVLHGAEHVFGSAIVSVFIDDGKGGTINLGFSGDLGRFFEPYNLIEPDIPRFEYDTFMIESTYGGREHKPGRLEEKIKITNAMNNVFNRGGKIVIPAFMLQRHQDISSFLIEMQEEGLIPKNIKIYYDGGSIKSINNIYRVHDKDKVYEKLFNSKNFIFAGNNKDPEANEFLKSDVPSVIIAPSGMLNGGTIMQYLSILKSPKNACMLFGYQGAGTTGRKLLEASENGVKSIYVPEVTDNENESGAYLHIVKNVNLFQWKSFTTHGDQNDLLYFLSELKFKPNGTILINHGDFEEGQLALAEALKKQSFLRKDINVVLTQVGGKLSNTSPFTNGWQYKVNAIIEKKEKPKKTEDIIPIKEILITSKKYQPLKGVFDRDMFRKMWGKISPSGSFVLNDKQVDDILFAIYEKKIDKMDMVLGFIAGLIVKSTDEEIQNFLQNPFIKKEEKIEQNQKDNTELEEPQIIEEQELIKDIFTKKRKFKEGKNSKNDLEKQEFLILVKRIGKKLYSAEISFRSGTNSKKKIKEITGMDIDSLKEELVNLGYILPYMTLAEKGYTIVNADKVSAKTFINETKKDNTIEIEIKSSGSFIAGAIYYKGELIKTIKGSTKKALSNELRKLLGISDNIDLKNRTKGKKIEVILNESGLSIVKKILVKNSLQKPENIIEVKIITGKNKVEGLIYYKGNIIKQVFGNSKTDVSGLLRESGLIPTKTQLIDKDGKIKKITLNELTFAIVKELLKNPPILKKEASKETLGIKNSLKEGENNIKKIIPVSIDDNNHKVGMKQNQILDKKKNKVNKQLQLDKIKTYNTKKKVRLEKLKSNIETKKKESQQVEKNNNRLILLIEKRQRQIDDLIGKKDEKIEEGAKNLSPEEIKQLYEQYIKITKRIKFLESKIIKDITDENLKKKFLIYLNTISESIITKKQDKIYLDKIKNLHLSKFSFPTKFKIL